MVVHRGDVGSDSCGPSNDCRDSGVNDVLHVCIARCNDMVLGGTYSTFRRVRAMVKGRDILEGEVDRKEERSEVRRSFVVKKKMG